MLASLDKQIKSNPYYGQGSTAATSLAGQYRMPSSSQIKQSRPQQDALANDYDTYNSYHKEVDPYRSLTRVSQTVSEPVANYGPQSNPLGLLIEEQQQRPLNPQHRQQQVAETIGNDNNGNENRPQTSSSLSNSMKSSHSRSAGDIRANLATIDANNRSLATPSNDFDGNRKKLTLKTNNRITTLTGPLTKIDDDSTMINNNNNHDNNNVKNNANLGDQSSQRVNLRVRRDDSDERESDDDIDDGVWVDDDEDDSDNRQQSSDVNETAQDPEDETEEDQQEAGGTVSSLPAPAPGVIGGPHSYELSPNDLLVYQG